MKRASVSTIVLGGTLVSLALAYPAELAAGNKSDRGASVSAGDVSVSAGRGGASVSTDRGGASVSTDRGGTSVSTDRGGTSVSTDRGGTSVSTDRGGTSVSTDRGGTSVSTDRGGASVSTDRDVASTSTDRGGASVSTDRDGISVSPGRDVASTNRGDTAVGGGKARSLQADRMPADRSYKSYGSIGEWFEDLRTSWFGGRSRGSEEATTARASATQRTETSQSGRSQVNRVVQEESSTATATEGGSAVAKASNDSVIEQKN